MVRMSGWSRPSGRRSVPGKGVVVTGGASDIAAAGADGAPPPERRQGRRRRSAARAEGAARESARRPDYRHLRHPFAPQSAYTEDRIEAIHETALRVLRDLGIKVLLPEARALYAAGGARIEDDMVFLGAEIVEEALRTAPRSILARAGARARDLVLEPGTLAIQTGAGAPHATDLLRGRRPATLTDYRELTRLAQAFDVIHMMSPGVEPQDVPVHLRHYETMRAMLTLTDKLPFVFSRGTPQVADCFAMLRLARGLSEEAFAAEPWCYTIVNTNSPRQLDVPMAQGLIDFARAGQLSIVTPFTLMGAMGPVTVAGAMVLSHAEALAAIALTQLAAPGAPVLYGAFPSNVDMRSGAPAFGTPEQVRANLAAGQLARRIGLPWRSAAGCAANVSDAQAAHETQMSAWSAMLAGCTVLIHGAGWLEGGLTVSYEKLITDMEMLQILAEICLPAPDDDLAWDALAEVPPGGHFFGCAHTLERYATAFYEPLVHDWSNFGAWTEAGALDATERATPVWQAALDARGLAADPATAEALDAFVARRAQEGGAPPES